MSELHLQLFIEKVNRLERSRLAMRMQNASYTIQGDHVYKLNWIAVNGVSEDDLDAFVMNLRLLIQDKDGFSIRCISKLFKKGNNCQKISAEFEELRHEWKTLLNQTTIFEKPGNQLNYTNDELFNILVYGGLAHCDPKYVEEFLQITHVGAYSAFLFAYFLSVLNKLLAILYRMRELCKNVLKKKN
jgi:hypothetical protein